MGAVVVLAGVLVPLPLLALGGPLGMVGAALLILLGAVVIRSEIVRLPHRLCHPERSEGGMTRGMAPSLRSG
jgi:hypothetical protein